MPVKDLIKAAAARAGYQIHGETVEWSADLRRARLMADLQIGTVLDVGANVGRYGREIRQAGYTGRIVSFEPLSATQPQLRAAAAGSPPWTVERLALGEEDGEADLNVSTEDVWSSLLPTSRDATTKNLAVTGTERVRTARLDSLDVLDGSPTWLKLDVQGFELYVLRGAEQTLPQISAIECEMSVEPFYEGQPSVREMVDALDDRGFTLTAVNNGHVRESGRAMWIDGVFVRGDLRRAGLR